MTYQMSNPGGIRKIPRDSPRTLGSDWIKITGMIIVKCASQATMGQSFMFRVRCDHGDAKIVRKFPHHQNIPELYWLDNKSPESIEVCKKCKSRHGPLLIINGAPAVRCCRSCHASAFWEMTQKNSSHTTYILEKSPFFFAVSRIYISKWSWITSLQFLLFQFTIMKVNHFSLHDLFLLSFQMISPFWGHFLRWKRRKKTILDHTLVDPLTKGSDATAGRTVHVPSAPWVKLISDGEMVR